MKVSELTAEFLQEYVRADGSAATMLKPMLAAAVTLRHILYRSYGCSIR